MLTKALLVRLEALPGKETELSDFLTKARSIVMEEPGTIAWFAIQFGPSHPRHDSDVPHLISKPPSGPRWGRTWSQIKRGTTPDRERR